MQDTSKLAIDGGEPVIKAPLPSGVSGPSVIGEEEIAAVTELLQSQQLFRYRESTARTDTARGDGEASTFEKEAAEFALTQLAHALLNTSEFLYRE